jgi:putative DNA primase/helicase
MLTGDMTERAMILLYGESGTGKTQFLEALREVMGDFAGIAPASAFQPRQPGYKGPSEDLHKLRGKRLAVQSELDAGSRLNEALVKSIVGADTQTTRPLYGAPVDWQPEYTAFLATNHLPRISSSENAIWNRVKPIEFAQVFIDGNGQALNPSERSLGRRMAADDPDSILNWLLEGLEEYRRIGLNEPQQVTDWLNQYREDVDSCRQFLQQAPDDGVLTVEPEARGIVKDVYRSYTNWCHDNGIIPLGLRNFNARLESAGYVRKKQNKGITWSGLGIPGGQWIIGEQRRFGMDAFKQRE